MATYYFSIMDINPSVMKTIHFDTTVNFDYIFDEKYNCSCMNFTIFTGLMNDFW